MEKYVKYNNPQFTIFRKNLRNSSTAAEARLWMLLKQKKLEGRKFTRQKSVGNYIIDFYCPDEKLAVELDGEDHFWKEGIQKDQLKTAFLEKQGIVVVRFENKWVFEDIEYVLGEIKKKFGRKKN